MTVNLNRNRKTAYFDFIVADQTAKKILLRLNLKSFKPLKKLGCGSFGIAYLMPNGKVVKFTSDATEALASMTCLKFKKKSKYLVNYFDVFQFKDVHGTSLFGIVQEKVMKPNLSYYKLASSWSRCGYSLIAKNVAFRRKRLEQDYGLNDSQLAWLIGAGKDLHSRKIYFYDLHGENIMQRKDGQHVLIDLGGSSRSPKNKIPKLEK